jgi:hypothetical protein
MLLLMLVKENIIFTKVKRNILGQEVIRVLEKTVAGDQPNFKQGNYGGIAGWSDDGADITNEVKNIQQMIFCMIWLETLLSGY